MRPETPLLEVGDLRVTFRQGGLLSLLRSSQHSTHSAVDGVSFALARGETLGIVGESGSGKTTVGRTILRLQGATAGRIVLDGQDITKLSGASLRRLRRRMQMVFQDPLSSFNPRQSIRAALATPLRVHRVCPVSEIDARIEQMLRRVGLPPSAAGRYPHQLSGGQVQRAAIGRALMLAPSLLLADEAVSKLDVSVRAQILNLFRDIQQEQLLGLVFITHDLDVARFMSDRIMVMYFGQVVEQGPPDVLATHPLHPYTRSLMSSDTGLATPQVQSGEPARQPGCRYYSRCHLRMDHCASHKPPLDHATSAHLVACWAASTRTYTSG